MKDKKKVNGVSCYRKVLKLTLDFSEFMIKSKIGRSFETYLRSGLTKVGQFRKL